MARRSDDPPSLDLWGFLAPATPERLVQETPLLVGIEGTEVASQRHVTRHSANLHMQTAPALMLAAEGPVSTMPQ
jgi:hypothetical protein